MEYLKSRHNKSGFMMMEVMVTIAIVGLAIAPILMMQSASLRALRQYSSQIRLLFPVKNFWMEMTAKSFDKKETEFTEKRQINNPAASSTYKASKVGENSVFKGIKHIYKSELTAKTLRGTRESIVGFVYKPEREKK